MVLRGLGLEFGMWLMVGQAGCFLGKCGLLASSAYHYRETFLHGQVGEKVAALLQDIWYAEPGFRVARYNYVDSADVRAYLYCSCTVGDVQCVEGFLCLEAWK